jgi:tetratricopeptide (TPR) repeat protein
MSLLERFLGGGRSKAFAEGMTLLEEGNYAEAMNRLRVAALDKTDSPSGSLASFHFRQALVGEGRRLMRSQRYQEACAPLAEAVKHWELYPDLHCLYGTSLGLTGKWADALGEARTALRVNVDYSEARLLESVALQKLGRDREAADSLNTLVESGRRVSHWLIATLKSESQFTENSLPDNLSELLLKGVSGRSEKEEVAEAVAICRGGDWEQGLKKFAELVERHPRYPDYRTRLAAALFQVGRLDEAMMEVEAALALNETYRTAIDLKGLILADRGLILEARSFLARADADSAASQTVSPHEELFGSYLRAALALLTGDPELVPTILENWPDLVRNFARAELLLAASDHLRGRSSSCGRRLTDLADEWVAEPLFFFLLAAHHLEQRRYRDVTGVITRWPSSDEPDLRPVFLESCAAVCEGREPALPAVEKREGHDEVHGAAWEFLEARAAYLAGRDQDCWQACQELMRLGHASERILRLQLAAAANLPPDVLDDWRPDTVLPESCLPGAVWLAVQKGNAGEVTSLLERQNRAHPEFLTGHWLTPGFWLEPIRGWIA